MDRVVLPLPEEHEHHEILRFGIADLRLAGAIRDTSPRLALLALGDEECASFHRHPVMSRLELGTLAGVIYGALSAASMVPLQFPDKRAALLGAFLNRLAIGVVVGAVVGAPQIDRLRLPPWAIGLAAGVLLSAADAVITKAYVPILVLGALGGAVIGWLVGRVGR